MAHLIDDKTVAKMGHPIEVVVSDVGKRRRACALLFSLQALGG
jgi:hypothetical protein